MSKQVTIKIFSTLRQYGRSENEFCLPWHTKMNVQSVLEYLKIPDTVEKVILVNGQNSEPERYLFPDDTIILFPPITGG